jgi:hypothetical protein
MRSRRRSKKPAPWAARSGRSNRAGPGDRRHCRPAPAPCRDTRPGSRKRLLQFAFAHHRIERLDLAAARVVDDVAQVGEVLLQHVERAQPVQRLHRVIGIADPAVAVVPVALAARRFGDRGGERGNDRAGLLVLAQLQGDGAADHLVLPFKRRGQAAHPQLPVLAGLILHLADFRAGIAAEGFVRAEEEMLVAFHAVNAAFQHIADRGIGRKAQGLLAHQIADVVGATGRFGDQGTVITHRPQRPSCAGCPPPGGRCGRMPPGDTSGRIARSEGRSR